jgi:uncharacterized iron-regulated protein
MRTPSQALLPTLLAGALLAACGGDGGGDDADGFADQAIVEDYADEVVVPTYELLAMRGAALLAVAEDLEADPSEGNLEAARDAWVETRVPWEQSEAFLFGPVSANGYDPAMDSWPVNRTDLDGVLASNDELTEAYIDGLPETQKGFHTLEYLLWGEDSTKEAGDLTARELAYTVALAQDLADTTDLLATSWTDSNGGGQAYRDVFATAGDEGNTAYPSLGAAAQEILVGMSAICDEVANGKIADPFDARDPDLVESQFSFNSLLDFADNMRGVKNAYTGSFGAGGTSGRGLSDLIGEVDAALDARFLDEVDAAITAIDEIPGPFRDAIQEEANDAKIVAAQEAIRTVQDTIDGDLTAAVLGQ